MLAPNPPEISPAAAETRELLLETAEPFRAIEISDATGLDLREANQALRELANHGMAVATADGWEAVQ